LLRLRAIEPSIFCQLQNSTIIAGKRADTMAEVTFFNLCTATDPRALRLEVQSQCVLRALENLDDVLACDENAIIVHQDANYHKPNCQRSLELRAC
jgi:hypothetical protein